MQSSSGKRFECLSSKIRTVNDKIKIQRFLLVFLVVLQEQINGKILNWLISVNNCFPKAR